MLKFIQQMNLKIVIRHLLLKKVNLFMLVVMRYYQTFHQQNIINAQDLPVYPGFIDSHAHFYDLGFYLNQVDLKNTQSLEEVIDRVAEFDAENNSNFIIGRGWDQNDWNNKTFPTNTLLNEKFPDKPVVLRRIDGHAYLVNDSALKLAGINNSTKVDGGEIVEDW